MRFPKTDTTQYKVYCQSGYLGSFPTFEKAKAYAVGTAQKVYGLNLPEMKIFKVRIQEEEIDI